MLVIRNSLSSLGTCAVSHSPESSVNRFHNNAHLLRVKDYQATFKENVKRALALKLLMVLAAHRAVFLDSLRIAQFPHTQPANHCIGYRPKDLHLILVEMYNNIYAMSFSFGVH